MYTFYLILSIDNLCAGWAKAIVITLLLTCSDK